MGEKQLVRIERSAPGAFDRVIAYRRETGCTLAEAVKATGFRGTRLTVVPARLVMLEER